MLHSQRSDPHRSNLPSRLISSNVGEQVTDALLGTIAMILGERGGKKVHAENGSPDSVNRVFDFVAQNDRAVDDEMAHASSACPSSSHSRTFACNERLCLSSSCVNRCVSSALTNVCNADSQSVIAASVRVISCSSSRTRSSICLRLIGFRRFDLGSAGAAPFPFTG